jgi:hypothetical protein
VRVIVTIAIVGGVFGGILIGVIGNTVVGIATR